MRRRNLPVTENEAYHIAMALGARIAFKKDAGEKPGHIRYLQRLKDRATALWMAMAEEREGTLIIKRGRLVVKRRRK